MCLGGSTPNVPAPPPVARDVAPEVRASRDRSRQQALAAAGIGGTTATSPGGLTTPAPIGVKTLLGM